MAIADYALCSLDEVKGYLALGALSEDKDSWLEDQINLVSASIEGYCNRKFAVQDISSEIRDGNGRAKLRPLYYPIVQLSVEDSPTDSQKLASVQYLDDDDETWVDIETDVDNIVLNNPFPQRVTEQTSYNIELLEKSFPSGKQNVKLVYRAGETDSSKYGEVKMVAIEMVVMRYRQSAKGDFVLGMQSTTSSAGGRSDNVTYKNMKSEWKEVLNRYKVKF